MAFSNGHLRQSHHKLPCLEGSVDPLKKSVFAQSAVLFLLLVLLSIAAVTFIYDASYDGMAYHEEGVIRLREGWNPFHTVLPLDATIPSLSITTPRGS